MGWTMLTSTCPIRKSWFMVTDEKKFKKNHSRPARG